VLGYADERNLIKLTMSHLVVKTELKKVSDLEKSKTLQRFFKTKKGEYGEGDIFSGVTVPKQRAIAKKFIDLNFLDIEKLLKSKIHEERMVALLILVLRFKKAKPTEQKQIYSFYLKHTKNINNWDLVDLSAPGIVGEFLLSKDRSVLYKIAKSKNLWEKRIAILATLNFIRNNQFEDTLNLSKILLKDEHDLIHKAVGWMLREVGKKDQALEEAFLKDYYKDMPRTMLRYATEKFKEEKRLNYLKGKI